MPGKTKCLPQQTQTIVIIGTLKGVIVVVVDLKGDVETTKNFIKKCNTSQMIPT